MNVNIILPKRVGWYDLLYYLPIFGVIFLIITFNSDSISTDLT